MLTDALNEAEMEHYEKARTLVLRAVRVDRALRERAELVTCYDAVLDKRAKERVVELRERIRNWEVNPLETLRTLARSGWR